MNVEAYLVWTDRQPASQTDRLTHTHTHNPTTVTLTLACALRGITRALKQGRIQGVSTLPGNPPLHLPAPIVHSLEVTGLYPVALYQVNIHLEQHCHP